MGLDTRASEGGGLTNNQLKFFAMAVMTIDHVAAALVPMGDVYWFMRLVGRLAFPIYAWALVRGNLRTRSRGRYLLRLGLFALVSEVPFDLTFFRRTLEFTHQNVFFTLFLGEAMLWILAELWKGYEIPAEGLPQRRVGTLLRSHPRALALSILIWAVFLVLAELLNTDYSASGIAVIGMIAFLQPWDRSAAVIMALGSSAMWFFGGAGWEQACAGAAFLFPILWQSERLGRRSRLLQYFFYIYYPLHLTILAILLEILY